MRTRLSYITIKRSGTRAIRDVNLEVDRLRIGRGTHNQLELTELSVALDHAAVELRSGEPWIELVDGDALQVNDGHTTSRRLVPGDAIDVGDHQLRVLEPGVDFDLALEIENVTRAVEEKEALLARTSIGIGTGVLSQRRISWMVAAAVAVVAFAWPLLAERRAATFDPKHPEAERATSLPLSSFLSSGPISEAHSVFGDRCNACHLDSFAAVPDRACLGCHAAVGDHARHLAAGSPAESSTSQQHRTSLESADCVDCHHEHGGARTLARLPDALCSGCHSIALGSKAPAAAATTLAATDFASDHPEFRPQVVVEAGSAVRRAVSLSDRPHERSGLRFPHKKHLVGRLKAPDGEVTLRCADCHQSDLRGTTMKKIVFQQACERCHSLAFDQRYPDRHALHGDPDRLENDLFEFYATRALRGDALNEDAPEIARHRPGRDLSEPERLAVLQWVAVKTGRVRQFLLGNGGICESCHLLDRSSEEVGIEPVHLVPFEGAERWLARALFRHDKHSIVDCESCHEARNSETAEQLLLPGIQRCRQCHGGEQAHAGKISSPCIECHDFHRARFGPMRAIEAETAGVKP